MRPVLFVEVPRKVNNPNYETLGIEPLEISVRDRLGKILPVNELQDIGHQVRALLKDSNKWSEDIKTAREKLLYKTGRSGRAGAQALMDILETSSSR